MAEKVIDGTQLAQLVCSLAARLERIDAELTEARHQLADLAEQLLEHSDQSENADG